MNRKVCLLLLTLIVGLCIAFVPGVPTAHAAAGSSILNPGETLWAGQSLTSGNGYVLTMQGDGNLVLYTGTVAIWQSGTYGRDGNRVVMQSDGNLVIYTPSNQAVWYTSTDGNGGSHLLVQTDGNVVVYSTSWWPLWYTNTASVPASGQRLSVPFYTQYAGQRTQNMDCGPTSVAMVLSFYRKGPGGSGAGISQIRIQTGNSSGDTSFGDLERALRSYGSSYSEVPNNISLDAQMSQMRNAVLGGHPVIALIHGATLGRRAAYGDHWLVLRGFSSDGNTVYLQDPDTQSPRWSGWLPGGQITLSYSTFRLAVYQAQFGPSGIIVWS